MSTYLALLADFVIVGLLCLVVRWRVGVVHIRVGSTELPTALSALVGLWMCDLLLMQLFAVDTSIPPLQSVELYNAVSVATIVCLVVALLGWAYLYRTRVHERSLWTGCLGFMLMLAGADGKAPFSISPGWYAVNLLLMILGISLIVATLVLFRRARARG